MKPKWGRRPGGAPAAGLIIGGLVAAAVAATTLQGTIERAILGREAAPRSPVKAGQGATGTAAPSSWPTAMMTASPAPDARRSRANDRDLRPSPGPAPERPADTAPAPSGGRFADLLRRLRTSIDQGLGAGEIRDDVALDLGNVLSNLRRAVDPDDPREVRDGIARLREKVATRTREGAISQRRADKLFLILDGSS